MTGPETVVLHHIPPRYRWVYVVGMLLALALGGLAWWSAVGPLRDGGVAVRVLTALLGAAFVLIALAGLLAARQVFRIGVTLDRAGLTWHRWRLDHRLGWEQVEAVTVCRASDLVRQGVPPDGRHSIGGRPRIAILLALRGPEPPWLADARVAGLPGPFTHDIVIARPYPTSDETRVVRGVHEALAALVPDLVRQPEVD